MTRSIRTALAKAWLASATAILAMTAATGPVRAEVVDQAPAGFEIRLTAQVAASADQVYSTLVQPALWWNPDHTYSGKAANMSLDARAGGCFCENLDGGGSVMHQSVVMAMPGKLLRLQGGLGPFQSSGLAATLTWTLASSGNQTVVTLVYDFGGYMKGGFGTWPKAADEMLSEQLGRLKRRIETGSPEGQPATERR